MIVQHKVCELWELIYNEVEIKFTIVISLLEWLSFFVCMETYRKITILLIHLPVHGEQTEPNPVFVASQRVTYIDPSKTSGYTEIDFIIHLYVYMVKSTLQLIFTNAQ